MKLNPHKDIINHWLDGGSVSWCDSQGNWYPNYGESLRNKGVVAAFHADQQFRITPEPEKITYSVALFEDGRRWLVDKLSTDFNYAKWKSTVRTYPGFICWIHLDAVFELKE